MMGLQISLTITTMLSLQHHHITDLYCVVDDLMPEISQPKVGRPSILTDSELITILLWNTLTLHQQTLRDIYVSIAIYHRKDFPKMPKYAGFVAHCHRVLPLLFSTLQGLLIQGQPIKIVDSTMLQVCRLIRADDHKTCKGVARFGKNWQGWHYGFKLHASVDMTGKLCGVVFTSANMHDAQALEQLLDPDTKIAVGDGSYNARVMREYLWEKYRIFVLAPPHPKQKKKLLARWQRKLLLFRPKIESVFDSLKQHLHLVSSFPRSIEGYLLHYVRILLGYQISMLFL